MPSWLLLFLDLRTDAQWMTWGPLLYGPALAPLESTHHLWDATELLQFSPSYDISSQICFCTLTFTKTLTFTLKLKTLLHSLHWEDYSPLFTLPTHLNSKLSLLSVVSKHFLLLSCSPLSIVFSFSLFVSLFRF